MTNERITELVERYFAGETTRAEETALRDYFHRGPVAPDLEAYAPLFRYWREQAAISAPARRRLPLRRVLLAFAAALALLLVARTVHRHETPRLSNFPVAERQPVDWSRHEITDEREALRFLHTVFKQTSERITEGPEITLRELRQVERILD